MNLSDSRTAGLPPRRVSAMEAVLTHLRGAIERGEYAVGDKLPSEAELCRTLEVSRPVLREALRALQALGLTVARTGKGTFVVANTVQDPTFGDYAASDLMEVRRHVEIPVAGYAALRRTPEDLDRLTRLLDRMDRETDTVAWAAMDTLFHLAVAEASQNPVFRRVIEEIRDALARQSAFLNELGGRREQSNREHRILVEALAAGSERDAVAAMTDHLDRVGTTLTAILRASPAGAETPDGSGGGRTEAATLPVLGRVPSARDGRAADATPAARAVPSAGAGRDTGRGAGPGGGHGAGAAAGHGAGAEEAAGAGGGGPMSVPSSGRAPQKRSAAVPLLPRNTPARRPRPGALGPPASDPSPGRPAAGSAPPA